MDVLLGLQWGDEGKGKVVDMLGHHYQYVARFQGGPNAGHTIYHEGQKFVLHQIPSGIFNAEATSIIGNGLVLNPITLFEEIGQLQEAGIDPVPRLVVSDKAHLILPTHRLLDQVSELSKGSNKIGSTLRGIGPAYQDKAARIGLRVGDIHQPDFDQKCRELFDLHEALTRANHPETDYPALRAEFLTAIEGLRGLRIRSTEWLLHEALTDGKNILAEGAQGTMLDLDFGTYPFITSSSTITGGACTGLGVAPRWVRHVIGVTKAYCTRVGSGPFITELHDDTGERIRTAGQEFGATTGRPRRTGWLDLVALRYAVMLNGVSHLVITKPDVLDGFEEVLVCNQYIEGSIIISQAPAVYGPELQPHYTAMPGWQKAMSEDGRIDAALSDFVQKVSKMVKAPVAFVSTGPGRKDIWANAHNRIF